MPNSSNTMTKVSTTDVLIGNMTISNTATIGSSTVYTHAISGTDDGEWHVDQNT